MKEIKLNQNENIAEEDILNIGGETQRVLVETLKGEKKDNWKKIIIAGEMALLGINVLDNLSAEEREEMLQELARVRQGLKEAKDKKDYIDLARCVYRFKNIGFDYPELTNEEKSILESLPGLFRDDPEWHGHLNYIPQIAKALDKQTEEIPNKEDYEMARKYLEEKLQEGGEEELNNMIFAGLLVELSEDEAKKLLKGENWRENRWPEVLKMIEEARNKGQGYILARCLPPLRKLIEFRKRINFEK